MAPPIIPFNQAIEATNGAPRALLIGNGFSIRHFSYKTLLEKSGLDPGDPVRALFAALDTVDFERVIGALEHGSLVERTYKKEKRALALTADADKLRRALVHAIRTIHPSNRDDLADVIPACCSFLRKFGSIFTTNYDLLLNWVTLDDTQNFRDGFGLAQEENGFLRPFKTEAYCNIYNLHGGLHLFQTADGKLEKRLRETDGVIPAIGRTITQGRRLPLYVAESTSFAKLERIYASPYLRHCYETLKAASGPFFVFGLSVDQKDAHIYEALFQSDITHLYYCIHQPTAVLEEVAGELARFKERTGSEVDYSFVDSETANVWG